MSNKNWQTPSHAAQRAAAAAGMFEQAFQRSGFSEAQLSRLFEATPGDLGAVLKALNEADETARHQSAGSSSPPVPAPKESVLEIEPPKSQRQNTSSANDDQVSGRDLENNAKEESESSGGKGVWMDNDSDISVRKRGNANLNEVLPSVGSPISKPPRRSPVIPIISSPSDRGSSANTGDGNGQTSKVKENPDNQPTVNTRSDSKTQPDGKENAGSRATVQMRRETYLLASDQRSHVTRSLRQRASTNTPGPEVPSTTIQHPQQRPPSLDARNLAVAAFGRNREVLERQGFTRSQAHLILNANQDNPEFDVQNCTNDSGEEPNKPTYQAVANGSRASKTLVYGTPGNPVDKTEVKDLVLLTELKRSTVMRVLQFANGDVNAAAEYMMEERILDDPPRVDRPGVVPSLIGDPNWRQRKTTTIPELQFSEWKARQTQPPLLPPPTPAQNELRPMMNPQAGQGNRAENTVFPPRSRFRQPAFSAAQPFRPMFQQTTVPSPFGAPSFPSTHLPEKHPGFGPAPRMNIFQPTLRPNPMLDSSGLALLKPTSQTGRSGQTMSASSQLVSENPAPSMLQSRAKRTRQNQAGFSEGEMPVDPSPLQSRNRSGSRAGTSKRTRTAASKKPSQARKKGATKGEDSESEGGGKGGDDGSNKRKVARPRRSQGSAILEEDNDDEDDAEFEPPAKKRRKQTTKKAASPPWWSRNGRGRRKK